jgi:hypothetical protein
MVEKINEENKQFLKTHELGLKDVAAFLGMSVQNLIGSTAKNKYISCLRLFWEYKQNASTAPKLFERLGAFKIYEEEAGSLKIVADGELKMSPLSKKTIILKSMK